MLIYNLHVELNTLLIFSGVICPETNFIQCFLISHVLLKDHFQAIEYLIKILIVIIYICQFEQKLYSVFTAKVMKGFFQNSCSFLLMIQCEVHISLKNIKIYIIAIQYFSLF